jgi:hypothetical protein
MSQKLTYRERTASLLFVQRALRLGWVPFSTNATATKHFYYTSSLPTHPPISVSWFQSDAPSYTVGNTSTGSSARAMELLEKVIDDAIALDHDLGRVLL